MRLIHRKLRHLIVSGNSLAAPISPVPSQAVLGWREPAENSVWTKIDKRPLVLRHVLEVVSGP